MTMSLRSKKKLEVTPVVSIDFGSRAHEEKPHAPTVETQFDFSPDFDVKMLSPLTKVPLRLESAQLPI